MSTKTDKFCMEIFCEILRRISTEGIDSTDFDLLLGTGTDFTFIGYMDENETLQTLVEAWLPEVVDELPESPVFKTEEEYDKHGFEVYTTKRASRVFYYDKGIHRVDLPIAPIETRRSFLEAMADEE